MPDELSPRHGVQVHAHRGGAGLRPENTLLAFEHAAELGAQQIELDVRLCATGELVVVHDDSLKRVAGLDVPVRELPLDQLQRLDVGSHLAPCWDHARVPTLLEVFETLRGRIRFNVEVKEDTLGGDGTAIATALLIMHLGLEHEATVCSFNPGSLWRVRRYANVPLAVLYPGDRRSLEKPWVAPFVHAYALNARDDVVDSAFVQKAHRRGLAVNVWTVNDPGRMDELLALGVQGIITDRPDLALDRLRVRS